MRSRRMLVYAVRLLEIRDIHAAIHDFAGSPKRLFVLHGVVHMLATFAPLPIGPFGPA